LNFGIILDYRNLIQVFRRKAIITDFDRIIPIFPDNGATIENPLPEATPEVHSSVKESYREWIMIL